MTKFETYGSRVKVIVKQLGLVRADISLAVLVCDDSAEAAKSTQSQVSNAWEFLAVTRTRCLNGLFSEMIEC